jgi:hypothetical protein
MNPVFQRYIESLHPALERLLEMPAVHIEALPTSMPSQGIYLFSEGDRHLYVGRNWKQKLSKRLQQHSATWAQHNQAVFAFKLAREVTGQTKATYIKGQSRRDLCDDPNFAASFSDAKKRIRRMDLRFVEEADPLRQTLLEIYVALALSTPYNDFDTH